MASMDDILTAIKGATQNISQLVSAFGAPGRSVSSQTSPISTLQTVGTSALAVVSFNANRRGISFHNSDPTNNSTIFLAPATIAIGQGLVLVPGQSVYISADLGCNSGWTAIAGTGSSNKLMILEYV